MLAKCEVPCWPTARNVHLAITLANEQFGNTGPTESQISERVDSAREMVFD